MKVLLNFCVWIIACLAVGCQSYLILLSENDSPGLVVFDAGVGQLDQFRRHYTINVDRSAGFVKHLLHVDSITGSVVLKKRLHCDGVRYPNLFTVFVDSTSNGTLEYVSIPLRVLIRGCDDIVSLEDGFVDNRIQKKIQVAKKWTSETIVVFSYPGYKGRGEVCLRGSQPVARVNGLVPDSLSSECSVTWSGPTDPEWRLETRGLDLVNAESRCMPPPVQSPWVTDISVAYTCPESHSLISPSQHTIRVEVWFREGGNIVPWNETGRVRRTLRRPGSEPAFDRSLYVASVLEEQEPGIEVCQIQVKSRDPSLHYSMISLLDQRSQAFFNIDPASGIVSTLATLDREVMDVHYLRVTAEDESSLPTRTATTTLQINVGDVNDNPPLFEVPNGQLEATLSESSPIGTIVTQLRATDSDTGINAQVEYSLMEVDSGGLDTGDGVFAVDPSSGLVTTRRALDRETTQVYTLIAKGIDGGVGQQGRLSSTVTLVVRIQDENDNYPQFAQRSLTVTLDEDTTTVSQPIVASVKATDADEGHNGALRYAIIGGNTQNQFAIDSQSGDITLVKPLDYESIRSYRLVIRAQDGGSPGKINTTHVLINVRDVNDNSPRFYTSLFQESVSENVPVGFSIVRVQAYDGDEGENAEVEYEISSHFAPESLPVTVDKNSGWLYTTRQLDREVEPKLYFEVLAVDKGVPPRTGTTTVSVVVQDTNDNDPMFSPKEYSGNLPEDMQPGTSVVTVHATDPDENSRLHYEIVSGNTRGRFAVTTQNGRGLITLAQPLDYKQERRFVLAIRATDSGGRYDTANVYLNISDANTFSPVFDNAPYSATIPEDAKVGTTVLIVSASDADTGINAQITYSLSSETDEFSINPDTGAIITTSQLDRELISGYLLTVTAKDNGTPQLSDNTDVEITVTDVNDNPPRFTQEFYAVSISEDVPIGTSVVQVSATDSDLGLNGRVRYSVENTDMFIMEPITGVMRVNKALDRESVALYNIVAVALDRATPPLSSTVVIEVTVEDVNDSPPTFESDRLTMYIPENSPVGSTVGEIHARDPDTGPNAVVQYSIIGGEDSAQFSLRRRVGSDSVDLITQSELDYESDKKQYQVVIRASSPPLRSDAHLTVIVTDVNDNAPVLPDFQVIFNNFRECFPSGPIGRVPAYDADVSDKLRYRILSGNNAMLVNLNENTGEISLSPQLNTNVPKVATMEVSVSDGVNEVKAWMELTVRLITDEMLHNSVTVRLADMTEKAFLSPLLGYFAESLAAIIPCPKHNVYIFSVQDDIDPDVRILNVSFSVRTPDGEMYPAQLLQEKVYLYRSLLTKLSTLQVLPFDDNLCVREPCLNFEVCSTVLKFGNASDFLASDTVLFRPIYPVTTFSCTCPSGFLGKKEHYLCDTEINLCYSNPCKNGGECLQAEGGFTCTCRPGYTGDMCDTDLSEGCGGVVCPPGTTCRPLPNGQYECESCSEPMTSFQHYDRFCQLRARSFTKHSFITFPALRQRNRLHIKLKFSTVSSSGLLLYNGRYNSEHDFIALELIGSKSVQFSFNLGTSTSRVSAYSKTGLNDGQWHTVTVLYHNRTATVSLDECDTWLAVKFGDKIDENCAVKIEQHLEPRCDSVTESCHRFLDLTGPLQLGGLPSLPKSDFHLSQSHFTGCIADVFIDHKLLDLNKLVGNNGSKVGCIEREVQCASDPCQNGGTCSESWGTFVCQCVDSFGGPDCSQNVPVPWSFQGDGQLVFNPLLRPIQLPWETEFFIRTRHEDGFIMAVTIGQNITVMFTLEGGEVKYTVEGEGARLPWAVADGMWHRILGKLEAGRLTLAVDHPSRSVSAPVTAVLHNQLIGRLVLANSENNNLPGFTGCIKDIRLGTGAGLQLLQNPSVSVRVGDGCEGDIDCISQCPAPNSQCYREWRQAHCSCNQGYIGEECDSICDLEPCDNGGYCFLDRDTPTGYSCSCNATGFTGSYCEVEKVSVCPSSWWGKPDCGPCDCDLSKGYSPQCNSTTGQCYCKARHWLVSEEEGCRPCDCYQSGSTGLDCDGETGQCPCKPGVVGLHCDQCPNPYAQVTTHGCEVIYGGCPRHYSDGLWWEQTEYGTVSRVDCPLGAHGTATRECDRSLPGWRIPDLFNCTSARFLPLKRLLSQLENGEVKINTYVAVETCRNLAHALNRTGSRFYSTGSLARLYGSDVLVAYELTARLIKYETNQTGLALTHSHQADYIKDLVWSVGEILSGNTVKYWARIEEITGESPHYLQSLFSLYMSTLATNMRDTYTSPMETISPNMVVGLDVVSSESLYGYEVSKPQQLPGAEKETVILPDTSNILLPPIVASLISHRNTSMTSPTVMFPKYNNYIKLKGKFDDVSKILIPLDLLGIKHISNGIVLSGGGKSQERSGIVSYAFYKDGSVFPTRYDHTVTTRWGVQLMVASSVISVVTVNREGKVVGSGLKSPVRLQLWMRHDNPSPNSNPQCVRWTNIRGFGEWTRAGCLTELPIGEWWRQSVIIVNCTCTTLSTHSVLVDLVAQQYVREQTEVEEVSTWAGLVVSLWFLAVALLCVSLASTKSNYSSIYYNLILCLFLAQTLYLIALKAGPPLLMHNVGCKLIAICLHYLWLSALCWWLVSSCHLLRMLATLRDVNRGPMFHYYTLSYAGPGIVVALAVAVRPQHYANYFFCWISLYESVIWSMIGPGCVIVFAHLIALFLALRAAFLVNHTITSYGNMRLLVWLNVGGLPLMVCAWLASLVNASEHSPPATLAMSIVLPIHSAFLLATVACLDPRLRRWILLLAGKKLPPIPEPQQPPPSRSSMAYRVAGSSSGAVEAAKRHIGISNASTTSRSTTKTSSSPYRSDNQLRNTSTSSNYEQASTDRRAGHTSDSDSDGSVADGRSLDLASSHSSDDESTARRSATSKSTSIQHGAGRSKHRGGERHHGVVERQHPSSYNIQASEPPQLNIVANSHVFHQIYQPRWPHPQTTLGDEVMVGGGHRWTCSTISDNELGPSTVRPEVKLSNLYASADDDKHSLADKYLFPYTAEEDHSLVVRGSSQSIANSPSPLAMHHHQFICQDISENEKSTSETPV